MKPHRAGDGERTLAVFIDFENLGLGFGNRRDKFSIEKVLERLVEKGKIVAKKAYADWSRFGAYAASLHSAAVELVEIPKRSVTGKNSADIRMCVDAMDLAYSKDHIDTFVVVSGDSDFSPLVSKLKELGKHVIGLGLADATSNLLRDNCDEFIYYEDLDRVAAVAPMVVQASDIPETKQKAFTLVLDALHALRRENKEVIYSSMVKDTIKRKKPSFNEEYHGYRTFSDLLEDAMKYGLLDVEKHKTSGTYVITRFGTEQKAPTQHPAGRSGTIRINDTGAIPRPEPRSMAASGVLSKPEPRTVGGAKPEPRATIGRGPATKPAAEPAPKPPATRQQPAKPPAAKPQVVENDKVPLGRALIDEIDDLDDEIPSYRPRKSASEAAPAPKPVKAAEKPAPAKPQAAKPAAEKPKQPERRPSRSEAKPVSEKAARPVEPPPPPPKAAPATKPAAPPPPADDDFGAGVL